MGVRPEQLQQAFDLEWLGGDSLTPWASVYRGRAHDGQDVVVKRTAGSAARARAMANWTRALTGTGIPVVSPVELVAANPRAVSPADDDGQHLASEDGPDWWVVYPFVHRRPYAGSAADIEAAGDLLGRIHAMALPPELGAAMRHRMAGGRGRSADPRCRPATSWRLSGAGGSRTRARAGPAVVVHRPARAARGRGRGSAATGRGDQ